MATKKLAVLLAILGLFSLFPTKIFALSCSNYSYLDPGCGNFNSYEQTVANNCIDYLDTQECPDGSGHILTCDYRSTSCNSAQKLCNQPSPGDGYTCDDYCIALAVSPNCGNFPLPDPRVPCNMYLDECKRDGCRPEQGPSGVNYTCPGGSVCTGQHVCVAQPPTVSISSTKESVAPGEAYTISWDVGNNPSACQADNGWSGSKSTSGGSEGPFVISTPNTSVLYHIICGSVGGSFAEDSIVVFTPPCGECIKDDGTANCDTVAGHDSCGYCPYNTGATCPQDPQASPTPTPTPGFCSCSIQASASNGVATGTVSLSGSGCALKNYSHVNWSFNGTSLGTNNGGNATTSIAPGASGHFHADYWSSTGPGQPMSCGDSNTVNGDPLPPPGPGSGSCNTNLQCRVATVTGGGTANTGYWMTGDPGGTVLVGPNLNTSCPGKALGAGCYRKPGGGYAEVGGNVGGKLWIKNSDNTLSAWPNNLDHIYYWVWKPSFAPQNTFPCPVNNSELCLNASTPTGSEIFWLSGGGALWGENNNPDISQQYLHRNSGGGADCPNGTCFQKLVYLVDWDPDLDPIGVLNYQKSVNTNNGTKTRCLKIDPYTAPSFYKWTTPWGDPPDGSATFTDNTTSAGGTLTLNQTILPADYPNKGANPNPYQNYCLITYDDSPGEITPGQAPNGRLDFVFTKVPHPPQTFTLYAAPSCQAEGVSRVTLSWSGSTDATTYRVNRNGDTTPLATLDASIQTYTDNTATALNTSYSYVVTAVNTDGVEPNSNGPVSATTPYCDSTSPTVSYVNISGINLCIVPDNQKAADAKTTALWSGYQPIRVSVTDAYPSSGITSVTATLRNDLTPGFTPTAVINKTYTQTAPAGSGYYEFNIPNSDLTYITYPNNQYTLSVTALDTVGNRSTTQTVTFQTDNSCKCSNIRTTGGDVHANTSISYSCAD